MHAYITCKLIGDRGLVGVSILLQHAQHATVVVVSSPASKKLPSPEATEQMRDGSGPPSSVDEEDLYWLPPEIAEEPVGEVDETVTVRIVHVSHCNINVLI